MALKLLKLLSGILFLTTSARSQTGSIIGTVKQTNGEVVPFAHVYLENTKIGAVSDLNGAFEILRAPAGPYKILAQFIGFERQVKQIIIVNKQTTVINFELNQDRKAIDEVVITGTMKEISKKTVLFL